MKFDFGQFQIKRTSRAEIQLVIFDMDGCLMGSTQKDTLFHLQRISKMLKVKKTIISGRPLPYVSLMCELLSIQSPFAFEDGSGVYFPKKETILIDERISQDKLHLLIDFKNHIQSNFKNGKYGEQGKAYSMTIFPHSREKFESLRIELGNAANIYSGAFDVLSGNSSFDIVIKGVNKFNALKKILAQEKIVPDKTLIIGDSESDLPLINNVQYSGAPDNAIEGVKQSVTYCSKFRHIKGVVDILSFFNLL